jgi:hypothetical protein
VIVLARALGEDIIFSFAPSPLRRIRHPTINIAYILLQVIFVPVDKSMQTDTNVVLKKIGIHYRDSTQIYRDTTYKYTETAHKIGVFIEAFWFKSHPHDLMSRDNTSEDASEDGKYPHLRTLTS